MYLLRCRDGSLYTGWTVDLGRRLARHRAGVASRYTASRLPVELELAMPMPDRAAARREEARIKRLPRAAKLTLLTAASNENHLVTRFGVDPDESGFGPATSGNELSHFPAPGS